MRAIYIRYNDNLRRFEKSLLNSHINFIRYTSDIIYLISLLLKLDCCVFVCPVGNKVIGNRKIIDKCCISLYSRIKTGVYQE